MGYHLLADLPLGPSEQEQASRILVKALEEPNDEIPTITGTSARGVAGIYLGWYLIFVAGVCFISHEFLIGLLAGIFVAGFMSLLTVPIFLSIQDQLRANTLQRVAATSLAQVGTPPCIGSLYRYIRHPSIYRQEILQALRAVIPRVTSVWYGRLTADTVAALTGLAGSSEEALALAALDALEQAGGGSAVKAVERLAARSSMPHVRDRATVVLPILIARRENEKSSASLLRPSALNLTEDLVRPVYGGNPNVSHLLRASQGRRSDVRSGEKEK